MEQINRAFADVRGELFEHGLLDEGFYLDQVKLVRIPDWISARLSSDTMGCVWEWEWLFDWEVGSIFIPGTAHFGRKAGETLRDTIRHEFAHAWSMIDPRRVDGRWFRETFGARYDTEWETTEEWDHFSEHPEDFEGSDSWREHVSAYATFAPYEDFAETFMFFLRDGGRTERFRGRPGAQRKLRAVRTFVKAAASSIKARR